MDQISDVCVRAGELRDGGHSTEMTDVGIAEGQEEYKCLSSCIHTLHEVEATHKEHTEPLGHSDRVEQGVTDGYKPAICHRGQEVALFCHCDAEWEDLSCACYV